MIAKVRIAPVEYWCSGTMLRNDGEVGVEVEIITETMGPSGKLKSGCQGRSWQLTPESADLLSRITGLYGSPWDRPLYICEHMLEMD